MTRPRPGGAAPTPSSRPQLQYEDIESLRRHNPAWRLLTATTAPLIVVFLGRVFVEENVREISETELLGRLEDQLYALNQRLGAEAPSRTAREYLAAWSSPETPWLRRYYIDGSDEPHYDATRSVERVVGWVESLRDREFVGTESRLNTVFELLRQIVHGSDTDPQVRLAELRRRRHEIDLQIAATERGEFEILDYVGRRDRYQQFADTARTILADFREVEANLRALDSQMREKIATWQGTKGELLDEFVGNRAGIGDSDQGRSLQAFYDLLLSADRLNELTSLISVATGLDGDGERDRLVRIHYDWLAAAKRSQDIVGQLSEQLRGFLDEQVWLDNRRAMDLLHSIESTAVATRDDSADVGDFTFLIDSLAPSITLPMERPLYRKPMPSHVDSTDVTTGAPEQFSDALYEQYEVDPAPLQANVRHHLRRTAQTTLASILAAAPLEHGLEELITYLTLGEGAFGTLFDDSTTDTATWVGTDDVERTATMPRVIYSRVRNDADPGGH